MASKWSGVCRTARTIVTVTASQRLHESRYLVVWDQAQHLNNSTSCRFDMLSCLADSAGWDEEPGKLLAQNFDGSRHGISCVHTAIATRTRTGITFKTFHVLQPSYHRGSIFRSPQDRNQVNVFAIKISRCNGSTMGEKYWNSLIGNGNHRTRHVLVTATDSDEGIPRCDAIAASIRSAMISRDVKEVP